MSKYKEPGIPAYYLLITIVFMVGLMGVVMHYYNLTRLDDDKWKKETDFSVQAQIKDVFFDTDSKGRSTWSYANLDNTMLLINPINSSMLCDTLTMPKDFYSVKLYSLHDLHDAVEAKKALHLRVKKIPSQWVDDKEDMVKSCPHVDFSGQYLSYRGREVVELTVLEQ